VNTSAKCGLILFSVFQVDHENVALHVVSNQTLTSADNDFELIVLRDLVFVWIG
jgi:hypothetical protein